MEKSEPDLKRTAKPQKCDVEAVLAAEEGWCELEEREIPETKWIIPQILPEGLTLLAGHPKAGKSWLAFGLLQDIVKGTPAFGYFPTNSGVCTYLALEDSPRRVKRRQRLILGGERPPLGGSYFCDWPQIKAGGLQCLEAWCDRNPDASALAIDTFVKIRPGKFRAEIDYERDYEHLAGLQRIASDYQIAILLLHHRRKEDSEDVFNTVSGSTGLTGAADSVWILDKPRETGNTATLSAISRDCEDFTIKLRFDKYRWIRTDDSLSIPLPVKQQEIVDLLRVAQPLKQKDIVAQLGKSRKAVDNLIRELVGKDLIQQDLKGYSLKSCQ